MMGTLGRGFNKSPPNQPQLVLERTTLSKTLKDLYMYEKKTKERNNRIII